VIHAVKGARDILPDEVFVWQAMESTARALFDLYGYRELRTPIFEEKQLFDRGLGSDTDIVTKEMYTFSDRDGAQLTLRPEATAGIVRSVIENNLVNSDPLLKVYAVGPMFRRERPQKGRQRQFHQVDVEAFGIKEPLIDVEIVEMAMAYLEACGLRSFGLVLNSVGDAQCRPSYVEALRQALEKVASHLCHDCQRRSQTNPLRVLDCKVPQDQALIDTLPKITDHLCPECSDHFAEVRRQLERMAIPFELRPRLVRGLDYYTRTTFEVTSDELGAQNSILGGGRYDGLVQDLGGPDLTGVGFALGMERLALLLPKEKGQSRCHVFLAPLTEAGLDKAVLLQRLLRKQKLSVLMDYGERSMKAKMKLADKLAARYVAILGDEEIGKGVWVVRDMGASSQEEVAEERLAAHLMEKLHA